ncbi:MAG: hypothetical protein ACE5ET_01245 [Gammaproteobacteria bacterium]
MIHLVVAIPCEARPLLEHFALRALSRGPFRLYEGEGMRLIISGAGKASAAAAVAWLAGRHPEAAPCAWLNVGTAGHALRPLGQGLLAHKVSDAASGTNWYPTRLFTAPVEGDSLLTVDRPELEYVHAAAYEMEAAGFCGAAGRFAPWELIHCYKVISDNRHSPAHHISEDFVRELMTENLTAIAAVVAELRVLTDELATLEAQPPLQAWMLARWRFSQTQQRQLQRLLQRHGALRQNEQALQEALRFCTTAKTALACLRGRVEDAALDGAAGP